ncbi:prepilin-type N-terminal cleavage/methylation domain-containing protein [bacterium]|nr:prepilin-type N-terminal cleavage/methylation domain-containing protein [bacterium]
MRMKAFTLIELLIVVAIIAILAAIAVPNFLEAQTRARVSRVVGEARTVGIALESYCVDNRAYPPDGSNRGWYYPTFAMRWGDTYYSGQYLTTPISYVTDIPIDIFNTNAEITGYVSSQTQGLRVGQHYAVQKYTTNDGAQTSGSIPWAKEKPFYDKLKNAAWMTWSIGPSHNIGKNSLGDACWMIPYDPTNGTVSNGGIWRLSSGPMY